MLQVLFPKKADNRYAGYKITQWVLYLYIFKSFFSSCIHMFASDGGAGTIASVTLDAFSQAAADTVITMFGLFGMEQFVIGIIALVIVLRYKSLIPFLWGVYALEYVGRFTAHLFTPGLATAHTPPGAIGDTLLVPLAICMFIVSLVSSIKAKPSL